MTTELDLERVYRYFDPGPFVRGEHRIAIVGAGALGSHVGLTLARMGLPFSVYDPDVLKPHNIPTSAYFQDQIGRPKVFALDDICRQFVTGISPFQQAATGLELNDADFIFIGPDAMEQRTLDCGTVLGRRELFENITSSLLGKEALIDGRIGSDFGEVYTLDLTLPKHLETYRELYLPKDAETTQGETACGGKIVLPQIVQSIASLMVSQFVTICIQKFDGTRERQVANRIAIRTSPKFDVEYETWPDF